MERLESLRPALRRTIKLDDNTIISAFNPLYDDLVEHAFLETKPLLAHYTTIQTLELILRTKELWFSNPLFMNDFEEVRFGFDEGLPILVSHPNITAALGSSERARTYTNALFHYSQNFQTNHLVDCFVFCLSEHSPTDEDGRLSMWRGYGANGNGAAIVFDTAKLTKREDSPLLINKVKYATRAARRDYLMQLAVRFAQLLAQNTFPTEKLHLAAYVIFERLKLFALFTKHDGFIEEQEWRAVYLRERDQQDRFAEMIGYHVTANAVHPKLKFRVAPIENFSPPDLSLSKLVERILLGPSISSPVALATTQRMVETLGYPEIKDRVKASTIPFRPTP